MLQADGRAYFQPQFATIRATIPLKLLDAAMTELGASFGAASILHRQCPDPAVLGIFVAHLAFFIRSIDENGMMLDEDRFKALHQELLILHLADARVRYETLKTKPLVSPVVSRALDLIGDRLREDLRISEIAAYAVCSIRSLQKAFQTTFQTTITGFIRSERLKQARYILESPTETTNVTTVELGNGFSHLSDFARHYREAYGGPPSATPANARKRRLRIC
jgi:AraC-like DNA-binding protein